MNLNVGATETVDDSIPLCVVALLTRKSLLGAGVKEKFAKLNCRSSERL